jgi:hypothetical protein
MSETQNNAELNQVLRTILRGLLQYAGECWPWSADDETGVQAVIRDMVADQQDGIHDLADLLHQRSWQVDFGTYPTEYTDLHFIDLDYLLIQMVVEQKSLVGGLESATKGCAGDAEAVELLEIIQSRATVHLKRLQER